MRWAVGAAALCLISTFAFAQAITRPAVTTAVTVTNTSAQAVAGQQRIYFSIQNESTTATIACRFAGTAAINTAGSFTFAPLAGFVWDAGLIPSDALNCISSAASSPATIVQ